MCIAVMKMCHRKGVLYICLSRKPHGPNWLDEAYGRLLSVPCLLTLGVLVGLASPGYMGNTTCGESAHLYMSLIKRVY